MEGSNHAATDNGDAEHSESSSGILVALVDLSGTPKILKSGECRGGESGPDEAIARTLKNPDRRAVGHVNRASIQVDEDRDEGGALQPHFDLAKPVSTKVAPGIFHIASQAGNDQFASHDDG